MYKYVRLLRASNQLTCAYTLITVALMNSVDTFLCRAAISTQRRLVATLIVRYEYCAFS